MGGGISRFARDNVFHVNDAIQHGKIQTSETVEWRK